VLRPVKLPVTYLFVPGNRTERFDKALASGADAVIVDLEDAVSPRDKDDARAGVLAWVESRRELAERIVVRINDGSTSWFDADLAFLRRAGIRCAMLPKAEAAAQVAAVIGALPANGRVLPLIETARGVANVDAVAAAPGVERLVFGTLDYGVDLDLSGDDRGLIYPSARIALASRCTGLASPVAGVTPAIDDEERLLADLAFARAFGFGAKLCIHPKQVAAIRKALQPTAAEVDWARRVLAAAEGAQGAVQVDGRMVDRPVLLKARAILDRLPA
jgi:citrate lyase subunit beta/citryl-CoA lyase